MTTKSERYQWPTIVLSDPLISGPLTVFPITGGNGHGGDYMLLADAVEKGIAQVREASDGANVPVIEIENKGKTPLLGIQGEEYVGAKQNRTLNITVLAGPGITRIPVTCVEQGRWSSAFKPGFGVGSYESLLLRATKHKSIHSKLKSNIRGLAGFGADQGEVWQSVEREAMKHNVMSPTMAFSDIYNSKDVGKDLDEIIAGIEMPEGSRGAIVALGGRVVAADIFENTGVFERIWPRMLRSYALSALGTKGTPPSLEAAESFVSKPNNLPWNATPSVGLGEDVRWEDGDTLASALVWNDRFLHASVFSRI